MLTETAGVATSSILLVDDHDSNLLVLESLLDDPELNLIRVTSGNEALAATLKHDFALVLLDVHMPDMDGFEVAMLMRGNPRTRHIPIIFITAISREDCVFRGYNAGAVDYLRKPLDPAALRGKVRVFCDLFNQKNTISSQLDEIREQTFQLEAEMEARRCAEQKLAASEARFRSFMKHVPVATSIKDRNGVYVYVNEKFGDVVGRAPEHCLGRSDAELWPVEIAQRLQELDVVVRSGESGMEQEEVFHDGPQSRNLLFLNFPIAVSPDDFLLGSVALDVTERQRLEQQLAQTRKLEAIGQLAAGVAHEINTPLQFVGDNTTFLKDAFQTLSRTIEAYDAALEAADTESGEYREKIALLREELDVAFVLAECPDALEQSLDGLERATSIVRAMRRFSHPGDERVRIDIHEAIESTVLVCRSEWRYVAEIALEFDARVPPIACFPGELNQVLLNLITNAAQAIGEVQAEDAAEKGTIRIRTRLDGEWLEVAVSDTGPGVPEGIQAEVFNPFFTTKEVGKGTGQGLSLAHSVVVERHGGSIEVVSEEGQGATFVIRLPLNPISDEDREVGSSPS